MSLDLAGPLRTAVIEATAISEQLSTWEGEPAVFTRRPAPADATYPLAQISPDVAIGDQDGLKSRRPVVMRDLAFYGRLGKPGSDQLRVVEDMAYLARDLFHRQRLAITVPGYDVIDIVAGGPVEGPTDNMNLVGRVVTLTIRLRSVA